jgi:hypothetical protein
MKFLCVVGAFVLLCCVTVKAGGGGSSEEQFGGSSSEENGGRCYCGRNSCPSATGAQVVGCPNTNSFRQCTGAVCAVQSCPLGQVWSFLKNACSACDAGKHIAANLQVCVCNQGTTLDSRTGACVACPSAGIQEADRCYCPSNLARDYANNVCKACPADAPLGREGKCVCTSATLFFNPSTWTCSACPGTSVQSGRNRKSSCRCTGANQILYKQNLTCYTCPAGTTADRDNDECQCARNTGLKFDHVTGTCVCRFGFTLNASGVCAVSTVNP